MTDNLVETQEHLLLAVQGSNIGIFEWDIERGRMRLSPQFKALLGDEPGESPYERGTWLARVHPEDRDRAAAAIEACLGGGADSLNGDYRMRRTDGTYRWMLIHAVPFLGVGGRVRRLAGSFVDVTPLKNAQEDAFARAREAALIAEIALALAEGANLRDSLQESAEAIVRRLDAALARIWILNPADRVLELNASAGLLTRSPSRYDRIPLEDLQAAALMNAGRPVLVDDITIASFVPDREWMARKGLTGFAGYPVMLRGQLIGVLAVFGRKPLSSSTAQTLASIARGIAITIDRKRLEESRAQLAELLEATPDFVTIGQPEGPPLFINRAARRALAVGPAESIDSLFKLRAPGFGDFFSREILPVATRDGAWSGETEYLARDGRVIPVSQVTVAHRDPDGHLTLLSTISRDITESRRAEEALRRTADALRRSEQRTQFALEAAHAGIWEYDVAEGRLTAAESMAAVFGVSPARVGTTLESFLSLIHEDDRNAAHEAIAGCIARQNEFAVQFRCVWPDGSTHLVESRGRAVRGADGHAAHIFGVAQDITARKQLEVQLQQAQKIEAVGQLAGGLAHDFNNLLTVILGYGQLLADKLEGHDLRRDVAEVLKAGQRASELTRQLLAFSRQQMLQPVPLSVNSVVTEMGGLLRKLIGENVELALRLNPALDWVEADGGQLEQVLVNLSVNARDAMPRGGLLTIETSNVVIDEAYTASHASVEPGAYVLLAVTDAGTGITPEVLAHMFEPFFTTKERGKGTGLGLASVFGIVKQSGGHISVYSEQGRGTTFKIYLPRAAAQPASRPAPSVDRHAPGGSEAILVVEDEPSVRSLVEIVLRRAGYRVATAANANAALAVAATDQPIDLLLTDVVMPGLSGAELSDRLTAIRPALKVIYMSGFADDAIVRHGVLKPGMPFIQKPFTGVGLMQKVREVLDRSA
jgi:PAS domain S-box-containing protein